LRALKYLGYEQIEVKVMSVKDALHQLKLEISENENRKDFSFNEKMTWAKMLEEEYKKDGEKNMLSGLPLDKNLQRVDSNKQVAEEVGFGNKETYRQAKYISENADEEMIQQLDEKKLSINKAFLTLKAEKESLENQLETERERHTQDIQRAKKNEAEAKDKEIDKIKKSLERKEELLQRLQDKEELLIEYNNLQTQIDNLTKEKDSISRQINSALTLSTLVVDIEHMLKNQLAPIKYSRALLDTSDSEVVINNVKEIVECVRNWCDEINRYMLNKNNCIVIESEEI
jgi:ParB family chromosome partitioning protein